MSSRYMIVVVIALSLGLWVTVARSGGLQQPSEKKHQDHHGDHDHAGHDHGDGHDEPAHKPVEISDHHKRLWGCVGDWKTVSKFWPMGQDEPLVSYGTCSIKKILGGLGTSIESKSTGDHGNFWGHGIFTWNELKQNYEGSWIDNYSYAGHEPMTGIYDPKNDGITWSYVYTLPDGTEIPQRMVEKVKGDDKMVAEFYTSDPSGKEVKIMEITYTRT